jgi:hypothetical protein
MTNTITELIAWLKTNPGLLSADALYFRGQVADTPANAARRLVSVLGVGGDDGVLLDMQEIRVMVLGPQGNPAGEMAAIETTLKTMQQRLKTDYKTCGIAQIRVIGGIIGPGRTTEDRPWYEINLQLLT